MTDLYFMAPDADGEPTLWHSVSPVDEPQAILRRCEVGGVDRELHWRNIVAAMEAS